MNKKSNNSENNKNNNIHVDEGESKILDECEISDDKKNNKESIEINNPEIITCKNKEEKLIVEIESLKDRLLRVTAEYDNFRRRTQKEKENIYTDACEDVLKLILPVLDNLERANNINDGFDELKKGIDLTIKQFKDALNKLNVEEIDTRIKFDPYLHEAVMHCMDDKYDEKEIIEVFMKGYRRGDKVLRHSMVKVVN